MENKIEIYTSKEGSTQIEVQFDGETVWLNQSQLVDLFQSSKANISEHIKGIFRSGELISEATVRKFRTVRQEGKRLVTREIEYYNLDVIISVGYRVNSKRGIEFRQWATKRLKDYLIEGVAINEKRLHQKNKEIQVLHDGIRILSWVITICGSQQGRRNGNREKIVDQRIEQEVGIRKRNEELYLWKSNKILN